MKTVPKLKTMPKSIWKITGLIRGIHVESGTPFYQLTIQRRGKVDRRDIFSREGARPVLGGLLERMSRPAGGEAAIWTNGKAEKAGMGGGYTATAAPKEWGVPQGASEFVMEELPRFENLTLGIPFNGPEFELSTSGPHEGDR